MPFPILKPAAGEVETPKTLQEVWDELSNDIKIKLLQYWDGDKQAIDVKKKYIHKPLTRAMVKQIFKSFNKLTKIIVSYMSGKVVIAEATYDDEGNETSPIIYNEVPASVNALADILPDMLFSTSEKRYYITQFSDKNECQTWEDFKNLFV